MLRLILLCFFVLLSNKTATAEPGDNYSVFYLDNKFSFSQHSSSGKAEKLIQEMKRHKGTKRWKSLRLWCADFQNWSLQAIGLPTTASRKARSFLNYGKVVRQPARGDIVILSRGKSSTSGHVGTIVAIHSDTLEVISGNHNRTVGIGLYPKNRVIGYRRI